MARTITDAQFNNLIKRPDHKKSVLFVINAHNGTEITTFYWAMNGYAGKPGDAIHRPFKDVVAEIPEFSREISEVADSEVTATVGTIIIINENGFFNFLNSYGFDRQAIQSYLGSPDYPSFDDFRLIHDGFVGQNGLVPISRNEFELDIYDKSIALDVPLQTRRFTSGSSIGEIIPTCIGECFNVSPVLVDKNNWEYQVDEFNYDSITELRVNGNPSTNFKIGETGTPRLYADQGKFRLTTNPASAVITSDVTGRRVNITTFKPDVTGTTIYKCSDIIRHILTTKTTLKADDLDLSSFTQFNIDRPEKCHIYATDDDTVVHWYGWLLSSVLGFGVFRKDTGNLQLLKFAVPDITDTPDHKIRENSWIEQGISLEKNHIPVKKVTLGYQLNHTVQQSGLAGAVIEGNQELVALYGREYTEVSSSNTLHEGNLTSILWQSSNTIRYTFTGSPALTEVNVGDTLTCINADTVNNGYFVILGKGADYVDVPNTDRSDATDDEVSSNGYADITIGKHLSSKEVPLFGTLLTDSSESASICQKKAELFAQLQQTINVSEVFGQTFNMELGDTIRLETDELNLRNTTAIITAIENENYGNSTGSLTIFRKTV